MKISINPGSGAVQNGSKEQSELNIKKFIADLKIACEYEFIKIEESGRHRYKVWNESYKHEISMPAIPLKEIRYLAKKGQDIWEFPRLYIDDSSWIWKYGLGVCFGR